MERKKSAPEKKHIGTPRLLMDPLLLHGTERGESPGNKVWIGRGQVIILRHSWQSLDFNNNLKKKSNNEIFSFVENTEKNLFIH